jgi:uncharacterized protein
MPAINGIGWFEIATDQPAAAERFYGDVFGWELHDFEFGSYFRLAGYGESIGATGWGGFEDVVAAFTSGNGRAHWTTTFGVEDCDAAVARAVELGATVVREPSDAPYVRVADIRDPQGAVITLGQYKGE